MIDLEQLLREGKYIQIKPQGYSMYPLIVPGRDSVVIGPCNVGKLRKGDVILYRRDGGILVLHRIQRIKKEGLYLVGDNQTELEGPLRLDQVRGRMVEVQRDGKNISVDSLAYRCYSLIWMLARPFRHKAAVIVHKLKVMGKRHR